MPPDYRKIRKLALAYAFKRGLNHQDMEDFAQECCLYAFLHETDDIYVQRRFVDYLRKACGRPGEVNQRLRWLARFHWKAIPE